jgi:hypothetical protein
MIRGRKYDLFGYPGPAGKSAYQLAVLNGFKGTEEEWLASLGGGEVGTGFTTASVTGSRLLGTMGTSGLNLFVPNYLTTAANGGGGGPWVVSTKTGSDIQISTGSINTLHHGNFITTYVAGTSVNAAGLNAAMTGGSITVNTSGISINLPDYLTTAANSTHTHVYQTTGNYLTTAAVSDHTHSDLYQSKGAYLTTAMASNAGSNFIPIGNSTDYATSVLSTKFLTTAQAPGAYLTTAMQSASSSVFMKTGFTTTATAGTAVVATANTDGLKLGVPAFLTTAMLSQNTSLYQSTGAYLTTAMLSANTSAYMSTGERNNYQYTSNSSNNTSVYQALSATTKFAGSGTSATNASITLNSNGLAISVAAPSAAGGIAGSIGGNSTSAGAGYSNITSGTMYLMGGNNITLSQNGASVTIVGPTAGAGDGGNVLAAGGSTAGSTGTYGFGNANGISFSLNGSTITASHNAITSQSNQILTLYATSNTTGVSSTTMNASSLIFKGVDQLSVGFSAGSILLEHGGADPLFNRIAASNSTVPAGSTVIFSNSNNVSFGITNGSQLTASASFNGLTTAMQSDAGSNFIGIGNSTAYQTSVLSTKFLTTADLSQNSSNYLNTSVSSAYQTSVLSGTFQQISASSAYQTATLSTALMPLTYSSGFQTATLATKFLTTAAVSDHTHSNLYVNTSVSANFLTTAAQSGHTHASAPSITGNISVTSNSSAWSIAIGAYLTTAMLSQNTSLYQSTGAYLTTAMASNQALYSATSQFSASFINTGQTAGFLTTAAASNHSHGNPTLYLTNISGTTASASNGFSLSLSADTVGGGGTASIIFQDGSGVSWGSSVNGVSTTITASVNGGAAGAGLNSAITGGSMTVNTSGISINIPTYLTTAMASDAGSNFIAIGNSTAYQTSVLDNTFMELSYSSAFQTATLATKFLTTAMASNQAIYSATSQFSASFVNTGQSSAYNTTVLSTALMPLAYSSGWNSTVLSTKFLTTAALSGDTTKYIQAWELAGANTAGTSSSLQGTKLFFSGGNNITLSGNSNTIIISAGNGGGGGIAASIGGNSTSAGAGYSNITSGTMLIAGGSNITLRQAGSVVSIDGATANGPASVVFQDGNGITWASTVAGSTTTIGATANLGAPNRSMIEIIPGEYLTKVFSLSQTQVSKRVVFTPFWMDGNGVQASTVRILMSWVTNSTGPQMTYGAAFYSEVNPTSLALYDSTTATIDLSSTQSASYTGIRAWDITGMTKTLSEGRWIMGLYFNGTAANNMNGIVYGASAYPNILGYISGGQSTLGTNDTVHLFPWMGYYSATTAGFPANVGRSQIYGGRSADAFDFYAAIKEI